MITISAKTREEVGKNLEGMRNNGAVPGVLYGPKIKTAHVQIDVKDFEKVYKEAGGSSLITLQVGKDKYLVLIHEVQSDPLTLKPIHVDFYQPSLTEEIEAMVPIVFEGEAPAIKELGGTFVKNISEIEVKALPEKLPHEIRADVTKLKTFEDSVLVSDLILPEGVKTTKNPHDIIALVTPPEKVEEELAKPAEEKVEDIEKVEKEKKEEVPEEVAAPKEAKKETK